MPEIHNLPYTFDKKNYFKIRYVMSQQLINNIWQIIDSQTNALTKRKFMRQLWLLNRFPNESA